MLAITARQAAENALFPWGDYLADPARRIVIAAIPKSGCSDLKHWFVSLVEPEKLADPAFRLHAHCRAAHTLARFTPDERAVLLRDSFTMAAVREPASRIVSAYVEKFVRPAPDALFEPAREVVAHLGAAGVDTARGISFRQFVDFLAAAPDDHLDAHWRPQSSFLRGVRIDFLARMESLPHVLQQIGDALAMPPRHGGRRNSTGYTPARGEPAADVPANELHRAGILPPASDLLDDATRAAIFERFRDDALLYEGATDSVPRSSLVRLQSAAAVSPASH